MAETRGRKKTFTGNVVSDKMDKTIVVVAERLAKHPLYGKYIKKNIRCVAHDEKNECGIGDKVTLVECRPISTRKRWRLQLIVEKAK
jgi:small subunit ribosomal protein S17